MVAGGQRAQSNIATVRLFVCRPEWVAAGQGRPRQRIRAIFLGVDSASTLESRPEPYTVTNI